MPPFSGAAERIPCSPSTARNAPASKLLTWSISSIRAPGGYVFHGIKKELIDAQAVALGKILVQRATAAADFEATFLCLLEQLREQGLRDIVFGNIHLADVRAWYEERTTNLEFRHHEPLWGDAPAALVREFIARRKDDLARALGGQRSRRDMMRILQR